jgi:hypothetical protein
MLYHEYTPLYFQYETDMNQYKYHELYLERKGERECD